MTTSTSGRRCRNSEGGGQVAPCRSGTRGRSGRNGHRWRGRRSWWSASGAGQAVPARRRDSCQTGAADGSHQPGAERECKNRNARAAARGAQRRQPRPRTAEGLAGAATPPSAWGTAAAPGRSGSAARAPCPPRTGQRREAQGTASSAQTLVEATKRRGCDRRVEHGAPVRAGGQRAERTEIRRARPAVIGAEYEPGVGGRAARNGGSRWPAPRARTSPCHPVGDMGGEAQESARAEDVAVSRP